MGPNEGIVLPVDGTSFMPSNDNFEHDLERDLKQDDASRQHEKRDTWQLEKDMARDSLDQNSPDEKEHEIVATQRRANTKRASQPSQSAISIVCAWLVEHQIGISVNLVLLLAMTHLSFPRVRPFTRKFFTMSYYNPATERYATGWDDLYFVSLCAVVVTGVRVAVMLYALEPLAALGGIKRKRVKVRYAEQGWLGVYYLASWLFGMYIMYTRPYFFNLRNMWTEFPLAHIDGTMKWYYLAQFGFWLQQIIVVNIEERRKDYAQMFTHHIFTCALIFFSYGYYQTKVGNVVLCIMDLVDILLSAAKCLKYQGFQTACDIMFGAFLVGWLITRHGFYMMVCWSIYKHVPEVMTYGCYDTPSETLLTTDTSTVPFGDGVMTNVMKGWQDPQGVICLNKDMRWIFLYLLLGLQVILLLWFTMIVRVAYKVLSGKGAEEVRSEDEGEDTEEEEVTPVRTTSVTRNASPLPAYLEEEVTADKLYVSRRTSSSRSRRSGRTTGLHIPGHSDPKDILNRIGCETKTTDKE